MNADEEKGERKYMDHRKKYFERTLYIYIYIFSTCYSILIEYINNRCFGKDE